MKGLFSINSPLWNIVNHILHLLWLSLLWAISCVPVVTIGAATTALYSVSLKYVRKEEGYLTSSFFRAMKQNLKQATMIWLVLSLLGCFLFMDLIVYSRSSKDGLLPFLFMTFFFSLLVVYILTNIFIYPLLAKFDNSIRHTLLNSFFMSLRHWPTAIAMLMISFGILAVGFFLFPPILFLAPALTSCINSRFLVGIFDQYVPDQH